MTRSSPIEYWSKGSTVGWYFKISQGSGKIPYTCNRLIVNWWIFESGDFKITRWGFYFVRGFPYLSMKAWICAKTQEFVQTPN